jgi:hypothetical protein
MWLSGHRRLIAAVALTIASLVALIVGYVGVSGTTIVADQLSYIASGGLFGLFLLGVGTMLFWSEQRERELKRLDDLEMRMEEAQLYLDAIAQAMGLTESEPEPTEAGPRGNREREAHLPAGSR